MLSAKGKMLMGGIIAALILLVVVVIVLRKRSSEGIVLDPGLPQTNRLEQPVSSTVPVIEREAVSTSSTSTSSTASYIVHVPPKREAPKRVPAVPLVSTTTQEVASPTSDQEGSITSSSSTRDSDGDGLTDQDEIQKYHTDPQKVDTDGDTYPDGEEIKKGYNPLGPGKCAQPSCILSP